MAMMMDLLSGRLHHPCSLPLPSIFFDLVGFYKGDSVKYFCLDVEDSKIQIFEVTVGNQTENGNKTIKNK